MARVLAFDDDSDGSSPPPAAARDSPALPPPAQQPPAAHNRAGATSRPLKRVARFLGDDGSSSDEGNAAYGAGDAARRDIAAGQRNRTTAVRDVDRMFAEVEDEEDDGYNLPPPLNRSGPDATQNSVIDDTLTASGNSKGKRKAGDGFFDGDGGDDDATNDKIDAEKAKKPKRKPVLMNEERLLGDKGIRRLKENLKGFKIKGKGHEEDDLRRLMNVYQLWAHQMFPAGSFKDTISRVEDICKKRSMKSILKGWRDEASGKLPPPLARGADSDEDGPTRHANSDDENDQVEVLAYQRANSSVAPSQAGSPDRGVPKKSYFDDIPTSSPGGALSRDPEMEGGDMDLAESLFGGSAPAAVASTSRLPQSQAAGQATTRMPTSEVGFNDADLTFDLEEDEFDFDAEAEAAMREMDAMNDMDNGDDDLFGAGPSTTVNKGKSVNEQSKRAKSTLETNSAMDFYADPKASETRRRNGKSLVQDSTRQLPSSSPAPRRHEIGMDEEEENFDDFDFGNEEEAIMKEMELAKKKQRDREAAALAADRRAQREATTTKTGEATSADDAEATITASSSKTPSLTTSSSAQDVDFDLDDAFDEEFLKSVNEAEELASSQKIATPQAVLPLTADKLPSPIKPSSPSKTLVTAEELQVSLVAEEEEEEEDLYS